MDSTGGLQLRGAEGLRLKPGTTVLVDLVLESETILVEVDVPDAHSGGVISTSLLKQ